MALRGKKKTAIEILKKKAGNVSLTCEALKIGRTTFYEWKKSDEEFCLAVENVQEGLIDFVESALMKNINDGKEASCIFYLKTRGKDRGYVERQEIEHSGDLQIPSVINVKVHK